MDDAQEGQQEIHDAFQGYHSHEGYLDPAQVQAIANYMPDFAGMDPASQAAVMQQYTHAMPGAEGQDGGNGGGQQSDSDNELDEGADACKLSA
jgi:hypothetical protein